MKNIWDQRSRWVEVTTQTQDQHQQTIRSRLSSNGRLSLILCHRFERASLSLSTVLISDRFSFILINPLDPSRIATTDDLGCFFREVLLYLKRADLKAYYISLSLYGVLMKDLCWYFPALNRASCSSARFLNCPLIGEEGTKSPR